MLEHGVHIFRNCSYLSLVKNGGSVSKETVQKALTLLVIVGSLVLSFYAMTYIIKHEPELEVLVKHAGALGPLIMIATYGLLGASPVPSEPLTVINGALFGPFLGMMIAGTGNTLAAVVEYFIGSHISSAADFEERRKKLPFGLGKFPADSPLFLIGGRLIPGYGGKVVSVIGGMYGVSLWRYIWTTALPTFIGAALFAYGGFQLVKLF